MHKNWRSTILICQTLHADQQTLLEKIPFWYNKICAIVFTAFRNTFLQKWPVFVCVVGVMNFLKIFEEFEHANISTNKPFELETSLSFRVIQYTHILIQNRIRFYNLTIQYLIALWTNVFVKFHQVFQKILTSTICDLSLIHI